MGITVLAYYFPYLFEPGSGLGLGCLLIFSYLVTI
jgi:hypothetical protein